MATTIDYGSDYSAESSDYDSLTRGNLCPMKQGIGMNAFRECDGNRCAWWDADKERCAVLSIARKK